MCVYVHACTQKKVVCFHVTQNLVGGEVQLKPWVMPQWFGGHEATERSTAFRGLRVGDESQEGCPRVKVRNSGFGNRPPPTCLPAGHHPALWPEEQPQRGGGHITPHPPPVPRGCQAPGTPWQLLDFPLDGSSQNQNTWVFFCRFLVRCHKWRDVSCFILSLPR